MLDRIFTPLLLLAALGWSIAPFAAALHLPVAASQARTVQHVELPRVVVVARREPAATPLARNDAFAPATRAVH